MSLALLVAIFLAFGIESLPLALTPDQALAAADRSTLEIVAWLLGAIGAVGIASTESV